MSTVYKRLKAALQDAIAYKKGTLFLLTESIQITHQSHQSKPKKVSGTRTKNVSYRLRST